MTIYKHVLKKQKKSFLSAVVHFNSISTVHIKDQNNMSMTRKYLNHTLQTKTMLDIIMHFIKNGIYSISNANCMRKNVCPFQCLLSLMLSYST